MTERQLSNFWKKVDKTTSCWLWVGGKFSKGYGCFRVGSTVHSVHRLSWEIHNGPIPVGLQVLHSCDVRNCIQPNHLWLGTNEENNADMMRKKRNVPSKGEKHGMHKLKNEQVLKMRELLDGGLSLNKTASLFNVSKRTAIRIKHRTHWKHL